MADIVAGAAVAFLPKLGVNFSDYPKLEPWYERLMEREAWRKTELSAEDFEQFKRRVKVLVKLRRREMSSGNTAECGSKNLYCVRLNNLIK